MADDDTAYDRQYDALFAAGVRPGDMWLDTSADPGGGRPALEACLKGLAAGDTFIAWRADRVCRDLGHLVSLVCDLVRRGVSLKILAGKGVVIDTTSTSTPLVIAIFESLAEFESDLFEQRSRAKLAAAGVKGRPGGRPPKMTATKLRVAMAAMSNPETNISHLCKALGVHRQTLYRFVSPTGVLREDGRRLLYRRAIRKSGK